MVEAFAVTADVIVDLVMHDPVVARPIEADAESGVEREIVVPHEERLASRQKQRVHALLDDVATDLTATDILQIERRAETQPLVLLVVMEREPIDQAFMLSEAVQPWLPVATQVAIENAEVARAADANGDRVTTNAGAADGDVSSAVDENRDAASVVGERTLSGADERAAGEIDGEIVPAHDNER